MNSIISDILAEYVIPHVLQMSYKSFLHLKVVSTNMKTIIEKIEDILYIQENVHIYTFGKAWRHEIDQLDYPYGNFIICDNIECVKGSEKAFEPYEHEWGTYYVYPFGFTNYKTYSVNNTYNSDYIDLDNYEFSDSLNFSIYYLHYIKENLIFCWGFNIVVLPFIDDILTNDPNFIGFKRVEKNKWYKHDIIMNYSIDLNRDNKINF